MSLSLKWQSQNHDFVSITQSPVLRATTFNASLCKSSSELER